MQPGMAQVILRSTPGQLAGYTAEATLFDYGEGNFQFWNGQWNTRSCWCDTVRLKETSMCTTYYQEISIPSCSCTFKNLKTLSPVQQIVLLSTGLKETWWIGVFANVETWVAATGRPLSQAQYTTVQLCFPEGDDCLIMWNSISFWNSLGIVILWLNKHEHNHSMAKYK